MKIVTNWDWNYVSDLITGRSESEMCVNVQSDFLVSVSHLQIYRLYCYRKYSCLSYNLRSRLSLTSFRLFTDLFTRSILLHSQTVTPGWRKLVQLGLMSNPDRMKAPVLLWFLLLLGTSSSADTSPASERSVPPPQSLPRITAQVALFSANKTSIKITVLSKYLRLLALILSMPHKTNNSGKYCLSLRFIDFW